jgi:hypothetical protein
MAATKVGKKAAGAGFTFIGVIVWVAAAAVSTKAHAEVASLWVIFGGAVAMGGIALMLAAATPIRTSRARR